MSNNYNIQDLLLKHNYVINAKQTKGTYIFTFPSNIFLNKKECEVMYTKKDYGMLVSKNDRKIQFYCPQYAIKSLMCIDLLFFGEDRNIGVDLIYQKNKTFNFSESNNNKQSTELLDIIISIINGDHPKINDDLLEGYNLVWKVIETRGII